MEWNEEKARRDMETKSLNTLTQSEENKKNEEEATIMLDNFANILYHSSRAITSRGEPTSMFA